MVLSMDLFPGFSAFAIVAFGYHEHQEVEKSLQFPHVKAPVHFPCNIMESRFLRISCVDIERL